MVVPAFELPTRSKRTGPWPAKALSQVEPQNVELCAFRTEVAMFTDVSGQMAAPSAFC